MIENPIKGHAVRNVPTHLLIESATMPSPRLVALITVLMLAASGSPTLSQEALLQLKRLEQLIVEKDCDGLVKFLNVNPSLMSGDDALARELQGFMTNALSGDLDCFAAIQVVENSGESDGTGIY